MTAADIQTHIVSSRESTANLFYPDGPDAISAAVYTDDSVRKRIRAIKVRQEYKAIETDQIKLAKRVALEQQTAHSKGTPFTGVL